MKFSQMEIRHLKGYRARWMEMGMAMGKPGRYLFMRLASITALETIPGHDTKVPALSMVNLKGALRPIKGALKYRQKNF